MSVDTGRLIIKAHIYN